MITRPMPATPKLMWRGHSDATLTPLRHTQTVGPRGGWPAPIRRTKSFGFAPGALPPVNKVIGTRQVS
jgi:hypothetical protein